MERANFIFIAPTIYAKAHNKAKFIIFFYTEYRRYNIIMFYFVVARHSLSRSKLYRKNIKWKKKFMRKLEKENLILHVNERDKCKIDFGL